MSRDFTIYLEDILDAIRKIGVYTEEMDLDSFLSDEKTQDAVIRKLIVIGEAARCVPEEM